MDGNLAMNYHNENMSEKDNDAAYVEFTITGRFPIDESWDNIDKIYAKGQRDGARWMVSFLSEIMDKKDAEIKQLKDATKLGSRGTVGIVYNWNQPDILKPVDCELLAIYKDGRIVVQCYDIHGEKWESETFSRIENFKEN